jgi:hypothetical protein
MQHKFCNAFLMHSHRKIVLLFFLTTLLQGCYVYVSEAYIEASANTDWHSTSKSGYSFLHGSDISIYVRTSNDNPSFGVKQYHKYFGVSLWFDPKNENFKFDPDEVSLVFPGLEKLKPTKVKLAITGMRVDAIGWECGRSLRNNVGKGPPYALNRGFCVEMYFEVNTPLPETSFSIYLDGLTRDRKKVVVPEIRFRKGSFWFIG